MAQIQPLSDRGPALWRSPTAMSRRLSFSVLIPALLLLGVLSGCGQKGPLYLPSADDTSAQTESNP